MPVFGLDRSYGVVELGHVGTVTRLLLEDAGGVLGNEFGRADAVG